VKDTAGPELLLELGILRVVVALGLFFGVQVVEVAEELVEPVIGWQVLVAIAPDEVQPAQRVNESTGRFMALP
jgi:hypothetical protein